MNEIAAPQRSVNARSRELWKSIPLDLGMSVFAIILAAGLKLAGILP